jgi:RNA:NAD 2'-phosphotransferase (TPT1/KptA family)
MTPIAHAIPSLEEFVKYHGGEDRLLGMYDLGDEYPDGHGFDRYLKAKYAKFAKGIKFPMTVWREISLPNGVPGVPQGLGSLNEKEMGVSWTQIPIEEGRFWTGPDREGLGGGMGQPWVFKAVVGPDDIDWYETMWARFYPSLGDQEMEITLKRGAKIEIVAARKAYEKEWRPLKRVVTAAPLHEDAKGWTFYHGTPSEASAREILRNGIQPRSVVMPDKARSRAYLAPVPDRVYLTTDIHYAAVYALEGDVIGAGLTPAMGKFLKGKDPYGYIFEVKGSDLAGDVVPDEDSIGEWLMFLTENDKQRKRLAELEAMEEDLSGYEGEERRSLMEGSLVYDDQAINRHDTPQYIRDDMMNLCHWLTERQREQLEDGEVASLAMIGKKLQKHVSPRLGEWMLANGAHAAHQGTVMPSRAWKFSKQDAIASGKIREILQEVPLVPYAKATTASKTAYDEGAWGKAREEHAGKWDPAETEEQSRERRGRQDEWEQSVLAALSLGTLSPQDADARRLRVSSLGGRLADEFKPLPPVLYHVTTAAGKVMAEGLKTRWEIGQQLGRGLGGGTDKAISFTADPKVAEDIQSAIVAAIRVTKGEFTAREMLDEARKGTGAERPWYEDVVRYYKHTSEVMAGDVPYSLDAVIRGVEYGDVMHVTWGNKTRAALALTEEEAKELGWVPAAPFSHWTGGDGLERYRVFERPASPEYRRDQLFDLFKAWCAFREAAGGRTDPLFFMADTAALARTDEDEVRVLECRPVPGAMGVEMHALGEWRTFTGKAIQVTGGMGGSDAKQASDAGMPSIGRRPRVTYHGTTEKGAKAIARDGLRSSSSMGIDPMSDATRTPPVDSGYVFHTNHYEMAKGWAEGVAGGREEDRYAVVHLKMTDEVWSRTELDPDVHEGHMLEEGLPPGGRAYRTKGDIPASCVGRIDHFASDAGMGLKPTGRTAALAEGGETVPPEPGSSPIPPGTIRLFHYTSPGNLPAIREQGLLKSRARGDDLSGTGPSAGIWASTKPWPEKDHCQVEFWAKPEDISHNADYPDLHDYPGQQHQDPEEWARGGERHVIMRENVPPGQMVAFHEPWHHSARHLLKNWDSQFSKDPSWMTEEEALDLESHGARDEARALRYVQGLKGKTAASPALVPVPTKAPPKPTVPAPPKPAPKPAETPAFKAWFRNSVVRNLDGSPKPVYHGSTHSFEKFDPSRSDLEGHHGKGMYFTDSKEDVGRNYATEEGPDLTNRIERRAEEIWDEMLEERGEMPPYGDPEYERAWEEVRATARKEVAGESRGVVYPVYLRIERPVNVWKGGGTWFETRHNEETGRESGSGVRLYNAVLKAGQQLGVDGFKIWEDAVGMGELYDDFSAFQFEEAMRRNEAELLEDPQATVGEFLSTVYRIMGFDGVVMADADKQFPNMGIPPGTTHYVVWNPRQAKSAIGNPGTFNPRSPRMTVAKSPLLRPPNGGGPRTLYHLSRRVNRRSIAREGLRPQIKEYKDLQRQPGVFFLATLEQSVDFGHYFAEFVNQAVDVWEAVLPAWYVLHDDPAPDMEALDSLVGYDPVPPECLRLVETILVPTARTEWPPFSRKVTAGVEQWEGKNVVGYARGYRIAVDDPGDAAYVTAWTEDNRKVGVLATRNEPASSALQEYLGVAKVEVDKKHRGSGIAFAMYRALLAYMGPRYKGIKSYLPDRANKRQVPKIWKRLGGYVWPDNEDWMVAERTPNKAVAKEAESYGPVYHGTPHAFEAFRTKRRWNAPGDWSMGAYFTDDPEVAKRFAVGPNASVKRVVVEMGKPLNLRYIGDDYHRIPEAIPWLPEDAKRYCESTHAGVYACLEFIDKRWGLVPRLKRRGYDGIIFWHPTEHTTYVVFRPEQVKSASAKEWEPWIGVDLDGTLAEEQDPYDPLTIGRPIPAMVEKVRKAVENGKTVKVFTARLADEKLREKIREAIRAWTKEHVGKELDGTHEKDPGLEEMWDDRARRVEKDKGVFAAAKRSEYQSNPEVGACMRRKDVKARPAYMKLVADIRSGVVYHGTTQEFAAAVQSSGSITTQTFEQTVDRVLRLHGKSRSDLTDKQIQALEFEKEWLPHKDLGDYISLAPTLEQASKWAGSGGEMARRIESAIVGQMVQLDDPESRLAARPVVLRGRLTEEGKRNAKYVELLGWLDDADKRMADQAKRGFYPRYAGDLDDLRNGFFDIRVPVGHVKFEGPPLAAKKVTPGPKKSVYQECFDLENRKFDPKNRKTAAGRPHFVPFDQWGMKEETCSTLDEDERRSLYDAMVRDFGEWEFPVPAFRAVKLQDIHRLETDGVGVAWTWEEDKAIAYNAWAVPAAGDVYVLKALVPEDAIDWDSTLELGLCSNESELRLRRRALVRLVAWKKEGGPWVPLGRPMAMRASQKAARPGRVTHDNAVWNGKKFVLGAVSLLDGKIEEVHGYEECVEAGWHHTRIFSAEVLDKERTDYDWSAPARERPAIADNPTPWESGMPPGTISIFWVDDDGNVAANQPLPEGIKESIGKQIKAIRRRKAAASGGLVLPAGTKLYRGVGEKVVHPPSTNVEGMLWLTESPTMARTYIPVSPGEWLVSMDHLVRPPDARSGTGDLQRQLGYEFTDVRYDPIGRAESWRYPEMYDKLIPGPYPRKEDFENTDEYYRVLFGYQDRQKEAFKEYVRRKLREYGYEPRGKGMDEWYRLKTERGEGKDVLLPNRNQEGTLLAFDVLEPLRLYDMTEGGRREGDLMEPDHLKHSQFEAAQAAGYDGVKINDFAQSETEGNVGHTAIGIFGRGLAKVKETGREVATHPEDLWGDIRKHGAGDELSPESPWLPENVVPHPKRHPDVLYHSAPESARGNILKEGIRRMPRAQGGADGIFFRSRPPKPFLGQDVWEVDARGLPIEPDKTTPLYAGRDFEFFGGPWWVDWTDEAIPPGRLRLHVFRPEEKLGAARIEGWRAHTGYRPAGTAADVIRFNREDLGNVGEESLGDGELGELDKHPASTMTWVTRRKEDAYRYGDESQVEKIVFGPKARIIVPDDGDGGMLVFDPDMGRKVANAEPNPWQRWNDLADAQRGEPEMAMLRIQRHPLAMGVYSFVVEHCGDLLHRMNEYVSTEWGTFGYEYVQNKVWKVLQALDDAYGFEQEMRDNERNNFRYYQEQEGGKEGFDALMASYKAASRGYADAHRRLPVFNDLQRLCQDAAVALGEWDFDAARGSLHALEAILAKGPENWAAEARKADGGTKIAAEPGSCERTPEPARPVADAIDAVPSNPLLRKRDG